ncbi:MAG: DUF4232 domain-containing protein [Acidimicrobiales bacterium]
MVALQGTGAAGSIFSPVEVVNISSSKCSLDGRPGITLIGALPGAEAAPLSTTVRTEGQGSVFALAPTTLWLAPKGVASVGFMVESSDVPSDGEQTCPVVSSMEVALPSVSTPLSAKESFTACGGPTISVSAIVPVFELQAA